MDFLKSLAPTIATLLGGPLAGVAVEALGKAFGMEDATRDSIVEKLQSGQLSGADVAAIKTAEVAAATRLQELKVRLEEVAKEDRDSARRMQSSVKSVLPPTLGFVVVVAFFYIGYGVLFGKVAATETLAGLLIGYLAAMAQQVMAYYFGSSAGSERKSDLLANSKPLDSHD